MTGMVAWIALKETVVKLVPPSETRRNQKALSLGRL